MYMYVCLYRDWWGRKEIWCGERKDVGCGEGGVMLESWGGRNDVVESWGGRDDVVESWGGRNDVVQSLTVYIVKKLTVEISHLRYYCSFYVITFFPLEEGSSHDSQP